MEDEEYISPELRGILEEFTRIRDAYIALKSYCGIQEETLNVEKERSQRMRENLEKLSKTYLLLEKRYKSIVEELQTERNGLSKTIEELKEQCDHLRLINTDRNGNAEDMCRLEDEVEVLKAQLSMQEEKHNEDMILLKQQHSDEIQRYKVLLQNAKQCTTSREPKKRGRPKNSNNSKNASCFRWPELSIQKINNTPTEEDEEEVEQTRSKNKKRKLFCEDKEAEFDIV